MTRLIVMLVWLYRGTLGHFMGGACRYTPTCSEYMLQAVRKHGPWRGGVDGPAAHRPVPPMGRRRVRPAVI